MVAPNAIIIIQTETNRNADPSDSLFGSSCLKSRNRNGDDKTERNMTTEAKEDVSDRTSVTVKTTKRGFFLRTGSPVLSSEPPGKVYMAAKATVAIRTATTEQPSTVCFNHSTDWSRRSSFAAANRPSAVYLWLFRCDMKCGRFFITFSTR